MALTSTCLLLLFLPPLCKACILFVKGPKSLPFPPVFYNSFSTRSVQSSMSESLFILDDSFGSHPTQDILWFYDFRQNIWMVSGLSQKATQQSWVSFHIYSIPDLCFLSINQVGKVCREWWYLELILVIPGGRNTGAFSTATSLKKRLKRNVSSSQNLIYDWVFFQATVV